MKKKVFLLLLTLIPSLAIKHALLMKFVSNGNHNVVQGEANSRAA